MAGIPTSAIKPITDNAVKTAAKGGAKQGSKMLGKEALNTLPNAIPDAEKTDVQTEKRLKTNTKKGGIIGGAIGAAAAIAADIITAGAAIPFNGAMIAAGSELGKGAGALLTKTPKVPSRVGQGTSDFNAQLNELNKGYYTGAGYKEGVRQLQRNTEQANKIVADSFGGSAGNIMAGLQMNQEQYGNAYGQLYQQMDNNKLQPLALLDKNIGEMDKRALDIDTMNYMKDAIDRANTKQELYSNFTGATAGKQSSDDGDGTDVENVADGIQDISMPSGNVPKTLNPSNNLNLAGNMSDEVNKMAENKNQQVIAGRLKGTAYGNQLSFPKPTTTPTIKTKLF